MTHYDRQQIKKDIAGYFNWRMIAGFLASTVITVGSVVWTAATLYYNNKAEIESIRQSNEQTNQMQDYQIKSINDLMKDCCPTVSNRP